MFGYSSYGTFPYAGIAVRKPAIAAGPYQIPVTSVQTNAIQIPGVLSKNRVEIIAQTAIYNINITNVSLPK